MTRTTPWTGTARTDVRVWSSPSGATGYAAVEIGLWEVIPRQRPPPQLRHAHGHPTPAPTPRPCRRPPWPSRRRAPPSEEPAGTAPRRRLRPGRKRPPPVQTPAGGPRSTLPPRRRPCPPLPHAVPTPTPTPDPFEGALACWTRGALHHPGGEGWWRVEAGRDRLGGTPLLYGESARRGALHRVRRHKFLPRAMSAPASPSPGHRGGALSGQG